MFFKNGPVWTSLDQFWTKNGPVPEIWYIKRAQHGVSRYHETKEAPISNLHGLKFLKKWTRGKKLPLAQMLLTNTASEASCEREFWKQRKILTNERNRTGQELAFTRIVFMTVEK